MFAPAGTAMNPVLSPKTLKKKMTAPSLPKNIAAKLPRQPVPPLAQRESEVIALVASDLPNKEIAGLLGIKVETVKNHIQRSLRKTSIRTRTGLAVWYDRQ
jgi:DNA-binding CsgD family transcriptional regulator